MDHSVSAVVARICCPIGLILSSLSLLGAKMAAMTSHKLQRQDAVLETASI